MNLTQTKNSNPTNKVSEVDLIEHVFTKTQVNCTENPFSRRTEFGDQKEHSTEIEKA
jgi:hypothetical protein